MDALLSSPHLLDTFVSSDGFCYVFRTSHSPYACFFDIITTVHLAPHIGCFQTYPLIIIYFPSWTKIEHFYLQMPGENLHLHVVSPWNKILPSGQVHPRMPTLSDLSHIICPLPWGPNFTRCIYAPYLVCHCFTAPTCPWSHHNRGLKQHKSFQLDSESPLTINL